MGVAILTWPLPTSSDFTLLVILHSFVFFLFYMFVYSISLEILTVFRITRDVLFFSLDICLNGFLCTSNLGLVCLYLHQICDSFTHCTDFSDEQDCGKWLPWLPS